MSARSHDYYQYRTLEPGEIRLLEIEPKENLYAVLVCHLKHCFFDDLADVSVDGRRKKKYEALSYAWGETYRDDSHLTDLISIEGLPLRVTSELKQALERFRQMRPSSRGLWVDAICIYQTNLQERNHQVGKISEIYSNARQTIIWLGELDSTAQITAMRRLRRLRYLPWNRFNTRHWVFERDFLCGLLQRQWFLRRWVIQEYMLSVRKTFVLGGQSLSHIELSLALGRLMSELARKRSPLLFQGEWSIAPAISTNGDQRKSHAGTLLHRLHTFQATEYSHPLDCVYALHGIAIDRERIAVDYSLQPQTLFLRIAAVYIRGYDTLALLFASALVRPRNPRWPSWLPDWHKPPTGTAL